MTQQQFDPPNSHAILDESAERAIEGVTVGISSLRRLRRRLPRWLRSGGHVEEARAIATLAAVQTALTLVCPRHLAEQAAKLRRQRGTRP